jgi:hypothetical protein
VAVILCEKNSALRDQIVHFSEVLKTEAHKLGEHGLTEEEFYNSGLFRGAIERIRGQFAASMSEKRTFMKHVLNYLQDQHLIKDWESSGAENRHDYTITLLSGRIAVVESKGCLDGNNTAIYERPAHANEFYIWSICTNPAADPRHNVWSGIHTRLAADIMARPSHRPDGLIVWDMVCGTIGRPCPKVIAMPGRVTAVGPYSLPPPCIYMFPATVPHPKTNPAPVAQSLADTQFLQLLHAGFQGVDDELQYVDFEVAYEGTDIIRKTRVRRGATIAQESGFVSIRRT